MIREETFKALLKEAQFTKEMLGAGATQIRRANYATKGIYFQAFTSLSTGLERIGKMCLMLDYYIENGGCFPDLNYLKNKIGHRLQKIYSDSASIVNKRAITLTSLQNLDQPIHQNILQILSDFAQGDRYSNIDLVAGKIDPHDSIASWFDKVDRPIFESRISDKRKSQIENNATIIANLMGPITNVSHVSETGTRITDVYEASYRTGLQEAIAPYRQLFVLQIIRFWVELIWDLQREAMELRLGDIPFFSEIFAPFYNSDSYLRTRKTWDKV